ncbi:hypothetical protein M427DRAFT_314527 [Gonapodya prolifera JEL478]|uniref:Uncharacterized protein n=1 Tax=Gonapodya prolifera (strain JEL478) TaxID=1344416 RepID=A0A139AX23_GONPJ|nr:hypothetical protein M427DRAFT_314527 [Gonapodya prolifera JEL478]|eukprot:KXS21257.1 hypothetical protein M427DRAFT_314527 [Gonapodya prolifera JEL478]
MIQALAWGSDCIFRKDVKGSSDSTTADFELSYSLVLSLSSGDILAIANNLISKPLSAHRGPVTAVAVGHEKDQEGAAVGWSVGSDLLLHSLRISSSNPTLLPAPAILSTIQLAPPMTPPILLHPLNPFECVLALSDGSTRRYNRMDSAWKSIDAAISGGATAAASSPVGSTFGELVAVCGRQGWRVSTPAEEVVAAGDEGGTCVGVTNVSGSTVVAIAVAGEVVQEDFMKWSRSPSASGAPVGGKTDAVAVYDVSSRGVQTLSLPLPARVRSLSWHTRGGALAAAAGDYIVVWKV